MVIAFKSQSKKIMFKFKHLMHIRNEITFQDTNNDMRFISCFFIYRNDDYSVIRMCKYYKLTSTYKIKHKSVTTSSKIIYEMNL